MDALLKGLHFEAPLPKAKKGQKKLVKIFKLFPLLQGSIEISITTRHYYIDQMLCCSSIGETTRNLQTQPWFKKKF